MHTVQVRLQCRDCRVLFAVNMVIKGIRAFTVNPGVVNTETLRATIGDQGIKGLQQAVAEPDEIGNVLLWIADNSAADELQYSTISTKVSARVKPT